MTYTVVYELKFVFEKMQCLLSPLEGARFRLILQMRFDELIMIKVVVTVRVYAFLAATSKDCGKLSSVDLTSRTVSLP